MGTFAVVRYEQGRPVLSATISQLESPPLQDSCMRQIHHEAEIPSAYDMVSVIVTQDRHGQNLVSRWQRHVNGQILGWKFIREIPGGCSMGIDPLWVTLTGAAVYKGQASAGREVHGHWMRRVVS